MFPLNDGMQLEEDKLQGRQEVHKKLTHDVIYDCIYAGVYLSIEEVGLYWMEVGPGDCRRGGSRVGFLRRHGPFSQTQEK